MKEKELLLKLEGNHLIEDIMTILDVNKSKAIYYIYRLRKKSYVKTNVLSNKKRVYNISLKNKIGGESYIDLINKHSKMKLYDTSPKVIGKKITIEETIIYAINKRKIRIILASLPLFKKIKNWKLLYQNAKDNDIIREVGILYDLSKQLFKVKSMDKRYLKYMLPKKRDKFNFLIPKMESKEFKNIENKWKVYLPFNKIDLEEIKNDKY